MSEKYTSTLLELLPPGFFTDALDSNIRKLLSVYGEKLQEVENHVNLSVNNVFADTADSTALAKWAATLRVTPERARVLFQLRKKGGANKQFYLDLLNSLGFDNSPERLIPVCRGFDSNSLCDDFGYFGDDWRHVFIVFMPLMPDIFNCNDFCDDFFLLGNSKENLRLFNISSPVHTVAWFLFYEVT